MAWTRLWLALLLGGCGPRIADEGEGDTDADDAPDGVVEAVDCEPFEGDRVVGIATIETDSLDTQIGLTRDHVVVFAAEQIYASSRCGGLLEPVGDAAGSPHEVTSDGDRILWAESGQVFATDPAQTSTRTLAQYEGVVSALAPDVDVVYAGLYFASEDSGVHTIPRDGSSGELLWATPLGERIAEIAVEGPDVYVLLERREPISARVVRIGADGGEVEFPDDVGIVEQLAVRDGALVLRRRGPAPDPTESVQGRAAQDGSLLWEIGGSDAPDMLQSIGGGLFALDAGSPTRLLEVPGPQPPLELTQMPFGPGVPVHDYRLGVDMVFDSSAAYWVEGSASEDGVYEVIVYARGY